MTLFPEIIVSAIIYGSLIGSAIGGIVLLALLWRDFKDKNIW